MIAVLLHIVGANIVPEVVTTVHGVGDIELEDIAFTGAKEVVQDTKPFVRIHFRASGTQGSKPGAKLRADSGEVQSCLLDVFLDHGDGDIFLLHGAVAANGFIQEHIVELLTVFVLCITLHRHQHGFLKIPAIHTMVVDGDFCTAAGIQTIEDRRVVKEHPLFIVRRCHLIVDIRKTIGFGILVSGTKNAVLPDAVDGDQILHLSGNAVRFLFLYQQFLDRFQHIWVYSSFFVDSMLSFSNS